MSQHFERTNDFHGLKQPQKDNIFQHSAANSKKLDVGNPSSVENHQFYRTVGTQVRGLTLQRIRWTWRDLGQNTVNKSGKTLKKTWSSSEMLLDFEFMSWSWCFDLFFLMDCLWFKMIGCSWWRALTVPPRTTPLRRQESESRRSSAARCKHASMLLMSSPFFILCKLRSLWCPFGS